METLDKLKGKHALITGATRGIGRGIAFMLAKAGCHLMLAARTEEALRDLAEILSTQYPDIIVRYKVIDASQREQVKQLAEYTSAIFPVLFILVNNVGLFKPGNLLGEAQDALETHMSVNVYCPHYLSVFFGQKMVEAGEGHIFNVGSVAGKKSVPTAASYSVTKYALHGLTDVLRQELGPYGVKVTELIPGSTFTSSWEGTDIPEEQFVGVNDIAQALWVCLQMSKGANVDEIIIRPVSGKL